MNGGNRNRLIITACRTPMARPISRARVIPATIRASVGFDDRAPVVDAAAERPHETRPATIAARPHFDRRRPSDPPTSTQSATAATTMPAEAARPCESLSVGARAAIATTRAAGIAPRPSPRQRPAARPAPRHSAAAVPQRNIAGRSPEWGRAGSHSVISLAETTAERATTEPIDRSMPPEMMTTATPIDRTPKSAMLCDRFARLYSPKKVCSSWKA